MLIPHCEMMFRIFVLIPSKDSLTAQLILYIYCLDLLILLIFKYVISQCQESMGRAFSKKECN